MSRRLTATPELRDQIEVLPRQAGVYLFLDGHGDVVYVGKSVNLRARVASYFHSRSSKKDIRMRRLIANVRKVRHFRTSSELSALLLEDRLIKSYQPLYNVRQTKYKGYQYLFFSSDRYPVLRQLTDLGSISNETFGPFPHGLFIERLVNLLGRYIGIRSCQETAPSTSCLLNDLGHCLAPCVSASGADAYPSAVARTRAILRGESEFILTCVRDCMADASKRMEFESAARCRDDLQFMNAFLKRQAFTRQFGLLSLRISDSRTGQPGYTFHKGDLVRMERRGRLLPGDEVLLNASLGDDPRQVLDRAHLVESWLRRNRLSVNYSFDLFA